MHRDDASLGGNTSSGGGDVGGDDPSSDPAVYPAVREARDYGFLIPIPLDTPQTRGRKMASHASHSAMSTLELESAPANGGASNGNSPHMSNGTYPHTILSAAPIDRLPPPALLEPESATASSTASSSSAVPHSSAPHPHRVSSLTGVPTSSSACLRPKLDRIESIPLEHMDVTFTRSMDVLALNTSVVV